MTQFIRTATVVIKIPNSTFTEYIRTITLSNLRIAFSMQKNLAVQTNPAVIRIWNLSQDNRNALIGFGSQVTVYAGYEMGAGQQLLYIGDTVAVHHNFEQPEIITVLECGDGDKYVNQKHYSLSFESGTTAENVIKSIASRMGVNIIEFSSTNGAVYEQGFSFAGLLKEALTKATEFCNLQWSIQNNGLQIIPKTGTIIQPAYKINANTGMIGIPQRYTFKRADLYVQGPAVGWKVNTLLDPLIIPGYRVDVSSRYLGFQGIFRVETVRHYGDTYGSDWQTQLELTQLPS